MTFLTDKIKPNSKNISSDKQPQTLIQTSTNPYQEHEIASDWRKNRITLKTKVKDDVPTIFIRDTVFGLAGSLSFITGLPKVGKTAIVAPILATAIANRNKAILQVRSEFCKGKMVVYIDTEQTESRTKKFRERVLRLSNFTTGDCSYFETLSLLNLSPGQRVETLKNLFEDVNDGLFMIVIDGLTDLLTGGVNDEQGSNEVIQLLMKEAGRTGATIVSIIHENRGTTSARGHIGAEAERKSAAMLSIKKDREKQIHVIESKLARYGGEFEPIYFRWCDIEKDFVEVDGAIVAPSKDPIDKEALKLEKLQKAVKQAFATSSELTKPNAINNLLLYADTKGKSEKTGQRLLQDCINYGFLKMKDEKTVLLTL